MAHMQKYFEELSPNEASDIYDDIKAAGSLLDIRTVQQLCTKFVADGRFPSNKKALIFNIIGRCLQTFRHLTYKENGTDWLQLGPSAPLQDLTKQYRRALLNGMLDCVAIGCAAVIMGYPEPPAGCTNHHYPFKRTSKSNNALYNDFDRLYEFPQELRKQNGTATMALLLLEAFHACGGHCVTIGLDRIAAGSALTVGSLKDCIQSSGIANYTHWDWRGNRDSKGTKGPRYFPIAITYMAIVPHLDKGKRMEEKTIKKLDFTDEQHRCYRDNSKLFEQCRSGMFPNNGPYVVFDYVRLPNFGNYNLWFGNTDDRPASYGPLPPF